MHDSEFFVSRYLKNCLDSNERNHSAALSKLNMYTVDTNVPLTICLFSQAQVGKVHVSTITS